MSLSISPSNEDLVFPDEGAYDFISVNGEGYCFPKDDILFVPILSAAIPGKGLGTKLVEELEDLVKKNPKLNEIAFPNIINPIMLKIVSKKGYQYREEFDENFGENVDIWYKTVKQMT